jgi:DNA (cytosine-5)-methyltransferase 1
VDEYNVVEVCAGAGGQSLGLEAAGFTHDLAVEIDKNACDTLRRNRPHWKIAQGDATSRYVWNPRRYRGADLLAGGVPCPPFTVAGKQLGATDERDLFAWGIELCGVVQPRALLLENVRGLSLPAFAAYRQHVLDRLAELGYAAEWRLLHASDYGVPQLRPRYVLVAMRPDDFAYFTWPEPHPGDPPTVGETLVDLMAANGWPGAEAWAVNRANDIAPTIVGGSTKHGGADLGPTRAKRAWRELGVDALSVADEAPGLDFPLDRPVKLTTRMVARIQGFPDTWAFSGRKTTVYRQVGNAFPPPVARAVGEQIRIAFSREAGRRYPRKVVASTHDPVYAVLRAHGGFLTMPEILARLSEPMDIAALERRLAHLARDFTVDTEDPGGVRAYKLGRLKAFTGQDEHLLHDAIQRVTARKHPVPRPPTAPALAAEPSSRVS